MRQSFGFQSLCLKAFKLSLLIVGAMSLSSCSILSKDVKFHDQPVQVQKDRLSIMTYNVENLFDTKDDPGKEDETYLPRQVKKGNRSILMKCQGLAKDYWREQCVSTNWTPGVLQLKMYRLAQAIRKTNSGKGPDVLIMEEVENQALLEKFRKKYLKDMFTEPAILLEGPDKRGIDVGILTRLKSKAEPKLHVIELKANKDLPQDRIYPTRGILQAELEMPSGESLYVFGVHFPSQGAPTEARHQAVNKLKEVMEATPKNSFVVAGGDFNITHVEEAHVGYFQSFKKDKYLVTHFEGCRGCRGTHYYHPKRSWSFLDALIFSPNFAETQGWKLDKKSIHIPTHSLYQVNRFGSPAKFYMGSRKDGVSDHWPMMADIYKSAQAKKEDGENVQASNAKEN